MFKLHGSDLIMGKSISFVDACLGTKIPIKTVCGQNVELDIPAGVQFNQVIRASNLGLNRSNGSRGDLMVQIQIEIPKNFTDIQSKLLKELKATL